MRIGIVNDVRIAAEILRRTVLRGGQHSVAWVARDGEEAVAKCGADTPDLVLMDLVMPRMDGVEATRQIMENSPCSILLVTASLECNASRVYEAMNFGAIDALATPVVGGPANSETVRALRDRIGEIDETMGGTDRPAATPKGSRPQAEVREAGENHIVCVGAGTGGPKTLAAILGGLEPGFPAGIVVVQHLDADFAAGLPAWLDEQTALSVRAAGPDDVPTPGMILVAASEDHLVLTGEGGLDYTPEPPSKSRPSVDVFFQSVADRWKGTGTGVLLTGMGDDGARSLRALRDRGFHTIAQDCDAGMPKAAIAMEAAVDVLTVDAIAGALLALAGVIEPA